MSKKIAQNYGINMAFKIIYKTINFEHILYIILFFALASGIILRSVEVVNRNYLFGFDQGRDYLAVKNIVLDHKLTLIGSEIGAGVAGFSGIFHGPFFYYLLGFPFLFFNGDPYGGMVLMYILGIGTIILGYIIGEKLFDTKVGLFTACILAVSPPFISYTRFIWNSNPAPLFILCSFYFVFMFTKKRKIMYLFWASFLSTFIYNFQLAIAMPLAISLFIYCLFVLRLRQIKQYVVLFLGMIIVFSPMLFFEIRHGFQAINGVLIYMFDHPETATTQTFWVLLLRDHLLAFFNNFLSTFPRQNIIFSVVVIAIFPATFYFVKKEKDKQRKQFILYFLFLIPVTFVVLGFLRNFVYNYYLIHLNLAYIFLAVFVIASIFNTRHEIVKSFVTIYISVLLITSIFSNIKTFYYDIADYGGTHKIRGKIDAIEHIYKDANGEKFGLLVFSPPIYTYPYNYLVDWYGKKKYGYIPHREKQGLVYLLIEKDTSKPWSYKGWLETVIKEGDILSTEQLTSGFVVQKRLFKE
ncbi:MAG: glycosyltransferase family 39 protein [Candidatus Levybacteria bacterium]|nr:glycosyltransferase family 39 protein [Candidatus Levybacteria bacterium]